MSFYPSNMDFIQWLKAALYWRIKAISLCSISTQREGTNGTSQLMLRTQRRKLLKARKDMEPIAHVSHQIYQTLQPSHRMPLWASWYAFLKYLNLSIRLLVCVVVHKYASAFLNNDLIFFFIELLFDIGIWFIISFNRLFWDIYLHVLYLLNQKLYFLPKEFPSQRVFDV